VPLDSAYCPACGKELHTTEAERQVALLRVEVSNLCSQLDAQRSEVPRLPQTQLLSDRFWTRAAAVFGHGLAFNLVVWVILYAIIGIAATLGR
jgi:hypothetical protein